jgi:hypothetical protein
VLCEETKGEAVITTGVGQHQMYAAQWYNYGQPRHWISSGGLGSMGFGLPAALGVAAAFDGKNGRAKKVVVDIDGDGSFLMNVQASAGARLAGVAGGAPRACRLRRCRPGIDGRLQPPPATAAMLPQKGPGRRSAPRWRQALAAHHQPCQPAAQELATVHIEKLEVKTMILNNQHLGMVMQWEDRFYKVRRCWAAGLGCCRAGAGSGPGRGGCTPALQPQPLTAPAAAPCGAKPPTTGAARLRPALPTPAPLPAAPRRRPTARTPTWARGTASGTKPRTRRTSTPTSS